MSTTGPSTSFSNPLYNSDTPGPDPGPCLRVPLAQSDFPTANNVISTPTYFRRFVVRLLCLCITLGFYLMSIIALDKLSNVLQIHFWFFGPGVVLDLFVSPLSFFCSHLPTTRLYVDLLWTPGLPYPSGALLAVHYQFLRLGRPLDTGDLWVRCLCCSILRQVFSLHSLLISLYRPPFPCVTTFMNSACPHFLTAAFVFAFQTMSPTYFVPPPHSLSLSGLTDVSLYVFNFHP